MIGAFLYLHQSERLQGKFDFLGAGMSVAGMVSLVYGFIHVAHTGWGNTETFVVFALAVVLLVGFVLFEAFVAPEPMMPMRIFESRNRSGAYLVMLVVGAAMFGMFYFITFFVQLRPRVRPAQDRRGVPAGGVRHRYHLAGRRSDPGQGRA